MAYWISLDTGPIGLGFRVPILVVSPFSQGGLVCSDVFDHTSTLRLLETRFGAEVPSLSAWCREATGDITTAFNFARIDSSVPSLPQPSAADSRIATSSCAVGAPLDLASPSNTTRDVLEATVVPPYPVTVNSAPPRQEPGSAPAPSGEVCGRTAEVSRKDRLTARGVRAKTSGAFHATIATFSHTNGLACASDFTNNVPVSHAQGLGATTIYLLAAGPACELDEPPQGTPRPAGSASPACSSLAMLLYTTGLLVGHRLRTELAALGASTEVHLLPPPCLLTVQPTDFGHAAELIEVGRDNARLYLYRRLPARRAVRQLEPNRRPR